MRYVELRAQLHRVLAVLKVRDSLIDPAFHRFTMTGTGITIDEEASAAEQILAEAAQQNNSSLGLIRTGRSG
jgi:circadian clock protein KaiC